MRFTPVNARTKKVLCAPLHHCRCVLQQRCDNSFTRLCESQVASSTEWKRPVAAAAVVDQTATPYSESRRSQALFASSRGFFLSLLRYRSCNKHGNSEKILTSRKISFKHDRRNKKSPRVLPVVVAPCRITHVRKSGEKYTSVHRRGFRRKIPRGWFSMAAIIRNRKFLLSPFPTYLVGLSIYCHLRRRSSVLRRAIHHPSSPRPSIIMAAFGKYIPCCTVVGDTAPLPPSQIARVHSRWLFSTYISYTHSSRCDALYDRW